MGKNAVASKFVNEYIILFFSYKVYKTFPLNEEHAALLKNLQDNVDVLDFWSELRSLEEPVDIMVPPEYQNEFVQFLQSNNIPFNAMVDDVQR